MHHLIKNKAARIAVWSVAGLIFLILVLPFTLYIPFVQNIVKDYACDYASKKTGLTISVDRILIKFPLDVSVDGALVLDEKRDTMVQASNLTAGIAVMPLLDLNVNIDEAHLTDGRYHLVSEDSSMLLRAHVKLCDIKGTSVDLKHNEVNLLDGALNGGDVSLTYLPYKVKEKPDTAKSEPWHIKVYHLNLNDVNYSMQMLPTIDTLKTYIKHARLDDGVFDTGKKTVDVRYLALDSVDCRYFMPTARFAALYNKQHPLPVDTVKKPFNPQDTVTWTVRGDSLRLNKSHAVYAISGARPSRGLDMNYIDVSDINVAIDGLYNRGVNVVVPIKNLKARERCGICITQGSGKFSMDSVSMTAQNFKVHTLLSDLSLNAYMEMSFFGVHPYGHVSLETDSRIALQDITTMYPEYRPMLKMIPQYNPISVKAGISGTPQRVDIRQFAFNLPRYARASVTGTIYNPMNVKRLRGDIAMNARFDNINFVKPTLLDKAMRRQVNLPPMTLVGKAKFGGTSYSGNMALRLATGSLVGKGSFSGNAEAYSVDATFSTFPVHAILPLSNVGDVTAHIQAKGHGFDFLKQNTAVNANVDLGSIFYDKSLYKNVVAKFNLNGGNLSGSLVSSNKNCDLNVACKGVIKDRHYVFNIDGTINDLNLEALNLYKGKCQGEGKIMAYGDFNMKTKNYEASLNIDNFNWLLDSDEFVIPAASASLLSNDSTMSATFEDEDTHMRFSSACGLDAFIKRMTKSGKIAMEQYKKRSLNLDTLQQALPPFNFGLTMGTDGVVQRYLGKYDMDFRDVNCEISNDSTIYMDGWIRGPCYGTTAIDTIDFHANEVDKELTYKVHMGNRPGTMDEFASVTLSGKAKGSTLSALLQQQNIKHETGYKVGVNAVLTDTAVNLNFYPNKPVIGYREWEVNDSNYVDFNYLKKNLHANLSLKSDSSVVSLLTAPVQEEGKEKIQLKVEKLKLEEWMGLMPFATPMSGELGADMNLTYDGKNLLGDGNVTLHNFNYDHHPEGDVKMTTNLTLDPESGSTKVDANMDLNGAKVAFAYGSLNDSTSANPFNVKLKLDKFPLDKASAFIPGDYVQLGGYLNGDLAVTGSMDKPILNGFVKGDSALVDLPSFGCKLHLSDTQIPVDSSVIKFVNYNILGYNANPVAVNGTVNLKSLDNMLIELSLHGNNVQFMGGEQNPRSMTFGKGFANVNCDLRGRGNMMMIRANLALLAGSNITYVMQEDVSSMTSSVDENMVTFVNLSDSTSKVDSVTTASSSYSMNIDATLRVEQGAKINAFLSTDGKDRVNVNGSGQLKYSQDFAGKTTLVGRYTVNDGQVRYSPPLISQKVFDFTSGSSIIWTGDMMNPQLDLSATEKVKASVTGSGQNSRLVDFLITANVTNTLSNMGLNFDMSTDNDLTVQNELQSMTPVQRSNAAINMLLYNSYTGTNTQSNSGITTSGALYSFLQSQLNSWAASTLKGVDLSFGINQYDETENGSRSTETSYSYRLSKSLFNDRFKVVIGGEYSTDATSEQNFSENLISDISFEYNLNNTGTKYMRLFRHTGYESLLEGEITQMGVGFVMKRKVSSLRHLFRYKPEPVRQAAPDSVGLKPTKMKMKDE